MEGADADVPRKTILNKKIIPFEEKINDRCVLIVPQDNDPDNWLRSIVLCILTIHAK
jgi:hypothetical protein